MYDGTTSSSQVPTLGTLFGSDTVTGLAQAFASKDVPGSGGRTLNVTAYTINDGNGGKDYTVTTHIAAGTITPAALTITATSDTKVYNGTTSSSQLPTLGRLFGGDTVTGLSQAFASKDVLGAGGSTLMVTAVHGRRRRRREGLHGHHPGRRGHDHPRTADHHRQQRDDGIRRRRAAVDGVVRRVRRQ